MGGRRSFPILVGLCLVAASCATTESPASDSATASTASSSSGTVAVGEPLLFDYGFDPDTDTIKLGVLTSIAGPLGRPLTGPLARQSESVLAGHRLYWDSVNSSGGVAGAYLVDLDVVDAGDDPELALIVFSDMEDEVLAFSSTFGIRVTAPVARLPTNGALIAAGTQHSSWTGFRNVVLNLGANTYFAQLANGPYWAKNIADPPIITEGSKVGIIYRLDDHGSDCLAGYNLAETNLKFDSPYEEGYAPDLTDFSTVIGGAQQAGVDVLFICADPLALLGMLDVMYGPNPYTPTVFGSSATYDVALAAQLGFGDRAVGLGVLEALPYYSLGMGPDGEADSPGMIALRSALRDHPVDESVVIDSNFYFGYTQAATFHLLLETAVASGDITRSGLMRALEQGADVDLGFGAGTTGLGLTAQDRLPSNADNIGVPDPKSSNGSGLSDISGYFEAPYLADWDPSG